MRTEMSKAEAITRIDRFLAYLEKIYTPQCDYDGSLIREDDITAFVIARDALKEQRPHGTCKTCKHYTPYRDQFSYGYRGDGYCKSTITNAEGKAYINCHNEWYCANYEKAGE